MTTSVLPQQGHRDSLRSETIPKEDQLALAEGTYLPDWPPATRQCRNSLGLNTYLHSNGVIQHVGLSNFTIDLINEAQYNIGVPIIAIQVEMYLFLQQKRLVAYARQHDVTLVAHTPLYQGLVINYPLITAIAQKYDATEAQISLAWLLQKKCRSNPKCAGRAFEREYWVSLNFFR